MMSKVWLITGCSSGLGIEIVRALLERGQTVIASSRRPSRTPQLVEEIKAKGGSWITLDVTGDVEAAVEKAKALHGRLDVLVNNAGFGINAGFEDLTDSDFQSLFDTNVFGVVRTTRAVLPTMRSQGSGTVINISSTSGLRGLPTVSAYAASKFALEGMSESIVAEYAEFGINVILVEPGAFRTAFLVDKQRMFRPASDFYKGTVTESVLKMVADADGVQPGDPVKAAHRMVDYALDDGLAKGKAKYLRLPLGNNSINAALGKADALKENFENVRSLAEACDFS